MGRWQLHNGQADPGLAQTEKVFNVGTGEAAIVLEKPDGL